MPGDDDYVRETLGHRNLQIDLGDPNPRPMIAVLDARPGMAAELGEKIIELVREIRREPGCLAFIAYQARDAEGRFYLYEVYASAAALPNTSRPNTSTVSSHRSRPSAPAAQAASYSWRKSPSTRSDLRFYHSR
jgi:hypothetical protein